MKIEKILQAVGITALGIVVAFSSGCGKPNAMNESTQNVKLIGGAEFEAEVTKSASPVVVDFYATWCGPCKMLSPMLDEMAGSFTNKIKFVKVNVDEAKAVAQQFNIQAIPTLFFFKDGKVTDTLVGLPSSQELKAHLSSLAAAVGGGDASK